MSRRFLVGLDFGGGGGRCLVVDVESGRLASAFRPWRFDPDPDNPVAANLDVAACWARLGEAAREALAQAGAAPEELAGVAATGMRHASILIDADGHELLATPNRDARGAVYALQLAAEHGEALHARTGHWPNAVQPVGRLRWAAVEAPELLARAATHLSVSDWIGFRLTGLVAAEPSQAVESGLFALEERDWAWDWIERLDLPANLFPPARDAGTLLGALRADAAHALGLPAGLPVGVGGGDTQCGLLGAGVVEAGQVGAIAGTTAPVLRVFDHPVAHPEGRLWGVHHVVPGLWALESNAGGMGEGLSWMAGLLYPDREHPELHLLEEAARSEPGAAGMVASVGAEVMDARALSLPVGQLTFTPLSSRDDPERRRHLARAVVEGLVFALRANLEQVETGIGEEPPPAGPLRLGGGISRSALFGQIASDVLGRPVEVPAAPETTALGAALCAGVAAGVFPDLAVAARRQVGVARRHEPDPERSARYDALYGEWLRLREARSGFDAAAGPILMSHLQQDLSAGGGGRDDGFRPRMLVAAELDDAGLAALRELGDVEYRSYREAMRLLTGPALAEALAGVHVFVTEVDVVDAPALLEAPDLRVVAVCRGDAVNVDLEAATALGIPVIHTPGRNADAVADLAVAYMLMLARKLPEASAFLREPGGEAGDMGRMGRAFGTLRGHELWRKQVGLIGLGAVGRKVVERLRPFGVRVQVHDPYLDGDAVRLAGAEPVSLETLLETSDFVSLHAAVTDASRGLIGRGELARMKPEAFLINTARAALLDEDALLEALRAGKLAGAALDVFSVEPPGSDHPLLALPNVIATPHIGGNTGEVAAHQGGIVADELLRIRRGERPRHLLNPEVWDGFSWSEPRPAPDPELRERLGRGPGPAVTDLQKAKKRPAERPRAAEPARPAPSPKTETGDDMPARTQMKKILAAFVESLLGDEALAGFAGSGQDVTLHFKVSDLGEEFHFGFREGSVHGGLGAPESDEDRVELKLSADLLDGMLTGRRNAMQAAMQGELSFSGDTAKAMTLTQVQRDLSRIYGAVREKIGDPGDLTALAGSGESAAAAPAARAQEGDIRLQLVDIVNELYAAQLITATGGNVSVRIPDDPKTAWITPSQLFKGDLAPEILVRIDMAGKALDPGARSPSSEALMHTAVLEARPDAQAVIHCHAPHATILANAGLPFLPISTEAAFLVNIGRIPFVMPGTRELADAIVEAMGESWAVLMQNHGLLVAGRSLRRAADMCEIIERTAQVIVGCYQVGVEPPVLPEETVKMLAKYGDLMA
jgi:autoinducer 2 (AI-2) kinase